MSLVTKTRLTGYVSKTRVLHWVLLILTLINAPSVIAVKPWPDSNNPQINKLFNPILPAQINVKVIRPVISGWNESSFINNWKKHHRKWGGLAGRLDWKLDWRINYTEVRGERFEASVPLHSTVTMLLPVFKYPRNLPQHKRGKYDAYLRDVYTSEMNKLKNIYYFHNRSEQLFKNVIAPIPSTNLADEEQRVKMQEKKIWEAINQAYRETTSLDKRITKRDIDWLKDVYSDFR
jgi:predicted secreted Zn-dependent protease